MRATRRSMRSTRRPVAAPTEWPAARMAELSRARVGSHASRCTAPLVHRDSSRATTRASIRRAIPLTADRAVRSALPPTFAQRACVRRRLPRTTRATARLSSTPRRATHFSRPTPRVLTTTPPARAPARTDAMSSSYSPSPAPRSCTPTRSDRRSTPRYFFKTHWGTTSSIHISKAERHATTATPTVAAPVRAVSSPRNSSTARTISCSPAAPRDGGASASNISRRDPAHTRGCHRCPVRRSRSPGRSPAPARSRAPAARTGPRTRTGGRRAPTPRRSPCTRAPVARPLSIRNSTSAPPVARSSACATTMRAGSSRSSMRPSLPAPGSTRSTSTAARMPALATTR